MGTFGNVQPHTGARVGLVAGGFAQYQFNSRIGIQLDLAYFQQGGTYIQFRDDTRFGAGDDFLTRNVKDASVILHNVFIPLQVRISPFHSRLMPKIVLGPYADINLEATEKYQRTGELDGGVYATATGEDVVTDQYEVLQFGAVGGFQFELPFEGNTELIVGMAYKYGITPVKRSHSYIDFAGVREDLRGHALVISVGVKFL